ncbi:hypothetical protein ACLMO3_17725 [Yersinia enterocolitica]|uniref:hypothetical protein n=1 Tax=Yersinia enterocolitica TaxID=630 RepID=UPI00398D3354
MLAVIRKINENLLNPHHPSIDSNYWAYLCFLYVGVVNTIVQRYLPVYRLTTASGVAQGREIKEYVIPVILVLATVIAISAVIAITIALLGDGIKIGDMTYYLS